MTEVPPRRIVALLKRWLPWLLGITLILVLLLRMPLDKFGSSIKHGPHLQLAAVDLLVTIATLSTDSFATWVGLIAVRMRRSLRDVFFVRGATYILVLLNYALGQGGFGYYLNRTGARPMRATGATLFLIGINLAALLITTPLMWGVTGTGPTTEGLKWVVVAGCAGFALYLVLVAARPAVIAVRQIFTPLFDAGMKGHMLALAGRIPHVAIIILGQWVALRVWGIATPITVAATVMPAVAIASSLPITPAGLGTSQAALIYFFADYAVGNSNDERAATVLAFSTVHFVYAMLASMVVGLACVPFARRATAAATTTSDATTSQNE